jgi:hypothetical protein
VPHLQQTKLATEFLQDLAEKYAKPKTMPAKVRRIEVWQVLAQFGKEQNRPKYTRTQQSADYCWSKEILLHLKQNTILV